VDRRGGVVDRRTNNGKKLKKSFTWGGPKQTEPRGGEKKVRGGHAGTIVQHWKKCTFKGKGRGSGETRESKACRTGQRIKKAGKTTGVKNWEQNQQRSNTPKKKKKKKKRGGVLRNATNGGIYYGTTRGEM